MIRKKDHKVSRKRIYFLFILFLLGFFILSYKLVDIQYLNASKYKTYADYQHMGESIISAKRGKILDRNGVEMAVSLIEKTVYANPQLIADASDEALILSEILGVDKQELEEKLGQEDLGFVYIKRKVSTEVAEEIEKLNLPGVYIQNEAKRFYPQNSLGAAIIGFTGIDNDGLSGIELQYEKNLRGVDGKFIAEKDVFGNVIPGDNQTHIEPINGDDIVLTIDSQIQYLAEQELAQVVEDYNALRGMVVIMNPNNGEIYAMANYPGFDPNHYEDFEAETFKLLGTSYTYEPGSTFKIVNISSALQHDCVGPDQLFSLPPKIQVGDRFIEEIFRTGYIDYSTKEIIVNSSNVGAVVVALSMGKQLFWESVRTFGFGQVTGIDFPGEESGYMYDYKTWPESTIGAMAIGQSITVTPVQMVRAASAIANGGFLVSPTLVKEIKKNEESILNNSEQNQVRILDAETSHQVKDMMLAVVEGGTGQNAGVEGVQVCGKTGTAEKANQNGVGYDEGRVITSFIGFAPYQEPKAAMLIVIDEPQGGDNEIWGGTVAAPLFSKLMKFSLQRLNMIEP
ncbi:MAG: penicillin-binding protein 2 [Actinomycetota bacterium]|nr:penicillin-binding protein 2 [Actinomycetota bacterium]